MKRIDIPTPCEASASDMSPSQRGSFCSHCQKEVIDFTRMSDAEIITFMQKQRGRTCGKFRPDQLARPLQTPAPRRRVALLASALAGLSAVFPQISHAQTTEQHAQTKVLHNFLRISLRNAKTQIPLSGAFIEIEGVKQVFAPGLDGVCLIPKELLPTEGAISLHITQAGFQDHHLQLPQSRLSDEVSVGMTPELTFLRVSGRVIEEDTEEPAPFVTIVLYGDGLVRAGGQTDEEGRFEIIQEWDGPEVEEWLLEARYLGGTPGPIPVDVFSKEEYLITLPAWEGLELMGDVVTVGFVPANSLRGIVWHIGRPFRWIGRKIRYR